MHVLAAPDKFKGTARASELASAIVETAAACGETAEALALSDGGDGLLDVFGGANRTTRVTGPLGTAVDAAWRMDGDTAVVESARASGLTLAGGTNGNDPMTATSAGTGELIAAAIDAGARRVLVGLGGSACTDGGLGALDAVRADTLDVIARGTVELLVCCDVTTAYRDAAREFAPQKGADAAQVRALTRRLGDARGDLLRRFHVDVDTLPGAGAAGGLAGGLAAAGGRLCAGFDIVAEHVGLERRVRACDLVVTGEGRLDRTSFAGKVVGGVLRVARGHHVPVLVVAGSVSDDVAGSDDAQVVSLVDTFGTQRAHDDVLQCVRTVVRDVLSARR